MSNKALVANRGAVASRMLHSLQQIGVRSVAVYSEADKGAAYLAPADESRNIGAAPPRDTYLNQDALLEVAQRAGSTVCIPVMVFYLTISASPLALRLLMLAKVIAHGPTRTVGSLSCRRRWRSFHRRGKGQHPFLQQMLADEAFRAGQMLHTCLTAEVLAGRIARVAC